MPLNKSSEDDINRLKNEAIKRANEAHKKASEKLERDSISDKNKTETENSNLQNSATTNIFESLMKDSERTLILVLILLLVDEGADMGLILALMYLII